MPRNAVELIHAFNAGRDPERLALKYRAMAADPFAFLRGSCHLFYQDYADANPDIAAPAAWICGDLHLENFGAYLDDDNLACFDLNDFGEAMLAPATWELSRFLVSLRVAAQTLDIGPAQARTLSLVFLDNYAAALAEGRVSQIAPDTAKGMVRDLLRKVRERDHAEFIDERTQNRNGKLRLRLDGKKALPVADADRDKIEALIAAHAETRPDPCFFKLLDSARRIAGTGSLGIERYVLLVRGNDTGHGGSPSLLDLRHEPGSALAPHVRLPQPVWPSEAARVVTLQRRMQARPPALLHALTLGERSYVLKELLPSQDRLELKDWNGKLGRLEAVMRAMGAALAGAQLRSASQQGAACGAELMEYGASLPGYAAKLIDHAETYAGQVELDWLDFRAAHSGTNAVQG
jgi:uncharacterized protein (DUF2252 family)